MVHLKAKMGIYLVLPSLTYDCSLSKFTKKDCKILICKDCIFIAGPGAHQSIILRELPQMYLRQYGYALRPENFGESNLTGMIIFMIFLKNDDYKVYHIELVQTKWL